MIQREDNQINWSRFSSTFIIETKRGNQVFTSTAVAISSHILLTAAHCVDCADEVKVILGNDYRRPQGVINITHQVVHPAYNPQNSFYENDVAILYTSEVLPNFTHIEEIDNDQISFDDLALERIGFGGRNNKNLKTWTNPSFRSVSYNKKNFILKDEKTAIGDSGGPVFANQQGKLKLIGLHSTLEGADNAYVVNLSQYIPWIAQNTSLEKFTQSSIQ
ncbi:MAG: trypsin-like serine protease [Halobacteriovoraceae bacterium]|jgi:V8-like Glu-specific endopeptidase|nr:trypsin-like serine protease [Halobacteriovoraceae bacterium]